MRRWRPRQTKQRARVIRSATTCVRKRPLATALRRAAPTRSAALGVRERHDDLSSARPVSTIAGVGERYPPSETSSWATERGSPRRRSRSPPPSSRARGRPVTSPSSPSASCRARIDASSFLRGRRVRLMPSGRLNVRVRWPRHHGRQGARGARARRGGGRRRRARTPSASRPCSSATTRPRTSTSAASTGRQEGGIEARDLRLPPSRPRRSCSAARRAERRRRASTASSSSCRCRTTSTSAR